MKKKYFILGSMAIFVSSLLFLKSRRTTPQGVAPVKNFEKEKYLGKWYEIARLDYFLEKNLINTTADYSLNPDESIKVVNRGYNYKTKKIQEATGKAKFVGSDKEAKLKVSFFEPFYSGYNVIAVDPDYKYALVSGKSLKYLWFLSRDREMPQNVKDEYLSISSTVGYDISKLIWVEQSI